MGWTTEIVNFGRKDREKIKEHIAKLYTCENEKFTWRVLYQSLKSNALYQAVERVEKASGKVEVFASIVLYSFEGRGWSYEFGYKEMDETCCPYYFEAPKKLIDMLTPTDSKYANEWRNEVMKKYGADKKPTVKVGDTIKFSKPLEFTSGIVAQTFKYCVQQLFGGKKQYYFQVVLDDGTLTNRNVRITNWRKKEFTIL